MRLVGIFGCSGFGREVMPVARTVVPKGNSPDTVELVFIDDAPRSVELNGHRVLSFEQWMTEPAEEKEVSIAVADPVTRRMLAARCAKHNIKFQSIIAPNAVVMDNNSIGEGAIVCPFVTITSNARIGQHVHANIYSYIAHDCILGDFVTLAPRVSCNGNVIIEDHVYVGTAAVLRQGQKDQPLRIGRGAVIGMGAVVTKDVEPGMTVVGNPARPMVR